MTGDLDKRLISRIGARKGRRGRSRAITMEPEVRTPIDIVPTPLPADGDRPNLEAVPALDPYAPQLGPYLYEWHYNVRQDLIGAFRDWLANYEQELRQLCPDHFRYLGTFEALFGTVWQHPSGRYRTLWQHRDLGGTRYLLNRRQVLDDHAGKRADGELREREDRFHQLLAEFRSFQDASSVGAGSQLYQSATR